MPLIKSALVPTSIAPFSLASIENQARQILSRAQAQAEQFLAAAQTEADAMKRAALAQGMAEGKKQGLAQGLEEGGKTGHAQALAEHKDAFTQATNALKKAAEQFEASRGELESLGLKSVIELSAAIARRVTKRQAMLDPEVLAANLQGAMKLVTHWADVRIAVHPKQLATVKSELPNLQMNWPRLKHVDWVEDATLSPGGCRVYTGSGAVDGDLDGQLDRMIDLLLPPAAG